MKKTVYFFFESGFGNNNAAVAVDYDEIIVVTDQAPLPKVPSPEVPLPKV